MPPAADIDDETEVAPVPLDRETRVRLNRLSEVTGKRPLLLAGLLLRDLLEEDERTHRSEPCGALN